jgi:long-chain acyl-CoA synthetase
LLIKKSDSPAILWKKEKFSFQSVLENITRYTDILPVTKPFKAAIISENRPEWIYSLYAIWHCGGIPILFDFTSSDNEIKFILEDSRPDILFLSQEYESTVCKILESVTDRPVILVFEKLHGEKKLTPLDSVTWNNIDDPALIVYTSGTTGNPKGAVLSFRNLMSNIQPIMEFAAPRDSILLLLPLFHIFPLLWTVIAPMYVGICTVFSPSLEPTAVLAVLQHARVTAMVGVPALYERIHKSILEKIDDSIAAKALFRVSQTIGSVWFSRLLFHRVHAQFGGRIKYLICGGAALDNTVQKDFHALGFPIYTGYGLTETSPMISFNKPGKIKQGSVGTLIPTTKVQIRDKEIVVQGDNVMQGYYNKPEETRSVFRDGWLYTGDTGYIDKEGFLYFTGRKKELIVLANGKNINPEIVEASLCTYSQFVKEAGVFERNGKLAALIVPATESGMEDESRYVVIKWNVIDLYNRSVPSFKKIYSLTVTNVPLPRTSLGKLKRYTLSSFAEQHTTDAHRAKHTPRITSPLLRYIQKEKKINATLDDNLVLDLGMDSLDLVLFLTYIESEYGIILTAKEVLRQQTVGALSIYIQQYLDSMQSDRHLWQNMFDDTENVTVPKTWWTIHLWQIMMRIAYRLLFRVHIEGKENIPSNPVLFICNHQSSLDQFLVTSFLTNRQFRTTFYLAKEFHYRNGWKQWLVDRHNVVLVHPTETLALALKKLARCLKQNKNVLIFPEGTRSPDGMLTEFKKSFALLSCALGIPVVPVVIQGTFNALPKGKLIPKYKAQVSIRFLHVIHPDGYTPASLASEIHSLIQRECEKNSSLVSLESGK